MFYYLIWFEVCSGSYHIFWESLNYFSAGIVGSKNSCNCEILHQEVQKKNYICLLMHLVVIASPMGEQMVKIKINDQTGKPDFPSAAHL